MTEAKIITLKLLLSFNFSKIITKCNQKKTGIQNQILYGDSNPVNIKIKKGQSQKICKRYIFFYSTFKTY